MIKNILLSGVGGQGIITASKIISSALFLSGYDVKKSEIHGLSQRGGSVISQIRFGGKVFSPVISDNDVDFFISLENLETLRYLDKLKKDSVVIINDFDIPPISVSTGKFAYPDNVKSILEKNGFSNVYIENAYKIAMEKFGNIKFSNSYIIGMFSNHLSIDIINWEKAFKMNIKEKFIAANMEAFNLGRNNK